MQTLVYIKTKPTFSDVFTKAELEEWQRDQVDTIKKVLEINGEYIVGVDLAVEGKENQSGVTAFEADVDADPTMLEKALKKFTAKHNGGKVIKNNDGSLYVYGPKVEYDEMNLSSVSMSASTVAKETDPPITVQSMPKEKYKIQLPGIPPVVFSPLTAKQEDEMFAAANAYHSAVSAYMKTLQFPIIVQPPSNEALAAFSAAHTEVQAATAAVAMSQLAGVSVGSSGKLDPETEEITDIELESVSILDGGFGLKGTKELSLSAEDHDLLFADGIKPILPESDHVDADEDDDDGIPF